MRFFVGVEIDGIYCDRFPAIAWQYATTPFGLVFDAVTSIPLSWVEWDFLQAITHTHAHAHTHTHTHDAERAGLGPPPGRRRGFSWRMGRAGPLNPSHAPLNPSHAPLNPSHVPLNPRHAPLNPSHAPLNPSHAPRNPSHAPLNPSRAASQPESSE